MTVHVCKSWRHFYQAILKGEKTHDLRLNDRNYRVGDKIKLLEYDFIDGYYTGASCMVEITYMTSNLVPCAFSSFALHKDHCILSLRLVKNSDVATNISTDDTPNFGCGYHSS